MCRVWRSVFSTVFSVMKHFPPSVSDLRSVSTLLTTTSPADGRSGAVSTACGANSSDSSPPPPPPSSLHPFILLLCSHFCIFFLLLGISCSCSSSSSFLCPFSLFFTSHVSPFLSSFLSFSTWSIASLFSSFPLLVSFVSLYPCLHPPSLCPHLVSPFSSFSSSLLVLSSLDICLLCHSFPFLSLPFSTQYRRGHKEEYLPVFTLVSFFPLLLIF